MNQESRLLPITAWPRSPQASLEAQAASSDRSGALRPPSASPTGCLQQELTALGLKAAATRLERQTEACERWAEAYARYPFVTAAQLADFQDRCDRETRIRRGVMERKYLRLVPIADYPDVPPMEVLEKLREAQALTLFDTFHVAFIEWQQVKQLDPLLFGKIVGCPDYFLIAEWGEDVSFRELAAP